MHATFGHAFSTSPMATDPLRSGTLMTTHFRAEWSVGRQTANRLPRGWQQPEWTTPPNQRVYAKLARI